MFTFRAKICLSPSFYENKDKFNSILKNRGISNEIQGIFQFFTGLRPVDSLSVSTLLLGDTCADNIRTPSSSNTAINSPYTPIQNDNIVNASFNLSFPHPNYIPDEVIKLYLSASNMTTKLANLIPVLLKKSINQLAD